MRSNVFVSLRIKRVLSALLLVVVVATGTKAVRADDYYLYGNWGLGIGYTTGIGGYVDTLGLVEDVPGGQYLFVAGGPSYGGHHYAYTYRVATAGNPATHPDNPDATGPIAPRSFTQVGARYYLGNFASGHENAFYVDNSGIYYGADDFGLRHWDFGWTNETILAPPTPITTQTLAYHEGSDTWWAGGTHREIYRYDGSSWAYLFTHPNLVGDHHDGMEIVGNSLFISDMTSDKIIKYRLDPLTGDLLDPADAPHDTYLYSAGPSVEGMGYGPNEHFWISGWSSGTIYEIGGGRLVIETIPVPGAALLGTLGVGLVGWLRRRRSL